MQVSDGAAGADTQVISVLLTDGNEAPVGLTPANAVVGENAASGTLVATVTAVDPDAGELFSFALVQDAAGRFAIDPASGRILVADGSRLDFESTPRHDLVVRVTDAGGLSHEQTLVVTLADVADTPVDSATTPPSPLPSAATAREVDVAAAPSAAAPAAQATQPHAAPPLSSGIESSAQADIGADQLPRTDDRSGGRRAVPRQPYQRVGGATLLASFDFADPAAGARDEVLASGPIDTALRALAHRAPAIDVDVATRDDQPHGLVEALQDPLLMASAAFTVGFVWWLTRSGGLLTTMLMAIPAWRHVDLLPVLARRLDDDDDDHAGDKTTPDEFDDDVVADLFDGSARHHDESRDCDETDQPPGADDDGAGGAVRHAGHAGRPVLRRPARPLGADHAAAQEHRRGAGRAVGCAAAARRSARARADAGDGRRAHRRRPLAGDPTRRRRDRPAGRRSCAGLAAGRRRASRRSSR